MKKKLLYLFLLLPVISYSQCPKWIGENADSTLLLKKITEKYLGVELTKSVDRKDKPNVDFVNNACSCEFLYSESKQRIKEMGNKKYSLVNKILIVGPEALVNKMYREYFYPLIKPCASSIQPTSMIYNGSSIGYYVFSMHKKKLAEIILHK